MSELETSSSGACHFARQPCYRDPNSDWPVSAMHVLKLKRALWGERAAAKVRRVARGY